MKLRPKKDLAIHPVMIGTAGHVDHGKTALVKILTGCDTDRLREEQERGLTIELGFAPCQLPGNRLAGIVDVPGHEDFIRNMVAGAASIDVLILVVAADDGVMPQTREHLQIMKLLRTPRVMAVVTKIDLVDEEMTHLVVEEVQGYLAQAGFPDAAVLPMSNRTATGITNVRDHLVSLVDSVEREADERAFRMDIERVFSVKGFGTVVTGIPRSGTLAVGDAVTLHPTGAHHSLRAVQTYKLDADAAVAHACAALNLRDCALEEVTRGMTLTTPATYASTRALIAHIENAHSSITLKRTTTMRLHAGTASIAASVRLIERETLPPGEPSFVHVQLDEPLVFAATDRFILRHLTPVATVAGGLVLSTDAYRPRPTDPALLPRLQRALEAARAGDGLMSHLLAGHSPLTAQSEATRLTARTGDRATACLRAAIRDKALVPVGKNRLLVSARGEEVARSLSRQLEQYHADRPYVWGMSPAHAAESLQVSPEGVPALVKALPAEAGILIRNGHIALKSFTPALSARQMEWREGILEAVENDPSSPPARGDLKSQLAIPEKEMKQILRLLLDEGAVHLIGTNLVNPAFLDRCRETMLDLFDRLPIVDIKNFRDATGTSRNLAVALLERFDTEGLTRRTEGGRVRCENTDA